VRITKSEGERWRGVRAADLAELLFNEVMDVEDAARYLGIARNSMEYAAYRKRVPFVHYAAKKLFTRADLDDYALSRGRGRRSELQTVDPFVVKRPADSRP
jgi:hypothetical protein